MRFVALVSGGKDSIYAACKLIDQGHSLVGLIYMNANYKYVDSYMFQTVGCEIASMLGRCFDCPLLIFGTACNALSLSLNYEPTKDDEVEDLFLAVRKTLGKIEFDGLCSGAILSNYQRLRVENVCRRHGLISLTPLWNSNQQELLREMIDYGLDARIVKIASSSLGKPCLGMSLSEIYFYYSNLNSKYEENWCGEGGEYETVVLDCKHFKQRILYSEQVTHSHPEEKEGDGQVFYLEMKGVETVNKK
ncbi:diphthine-ammonia ligase [Pancytospora epiphaga]|nr:diphthine-ammonia ligase [Pancytospora epiphaga]